MIVRCMERYRPLPWRAGAGFLLVVASCLSLFAPVQARAQSNIPQPVLRIETGAHTAVIRSMGLDAAGNYLVTASEDKTARVWDAHTGALLRVLRPPIGEGDSGKLFAVAITSDARWIACAGATINQGNDFCIYLFDRLTGAIQRRWTGLPMVITNLTFSPDGQELLAGSGGDKGIYLLRVSDGALIGKDTDYSYSTYGADFSPDGHALATASEDGYLRQYTVSSSALRLIKKEKAPGGTTPFSIRYSPDGTKLAVGSVEKNAVSVLSAADLSVLYNPNVSGPIKGDFSTVSWSADGQALYAGGTAIRKKDEFILRRWAQGGRGAFTEYITPSTILDLRPARNGWLYYGNGDPAWGALDTTNNSVVSVARRNADFSDTKNILRVPFDGMAVQFTFDPIEKIAARFTVDDRQLLVKEKMSSALFDLSDLTQAAKTTAPGLSITGWEDSEAPKFNGVPIPLLQYEQSRCLAIAPDNQTFLLGTDWNLRCYDRTGKPRWSITTPGATRAVNISGDGKLVIAAFADGTIRWYRMSEGGELLAFFPHADKKRWVAWTPGGYYDCSPGGEDLIGWHVGKGADRAADFFPASLFRSSFYRPDVVTRILATREEAEALRLADASESETGPPVAAVSTATVLQKLPPMVTILSPEPNAALSTSTITLRYSVRTPTDAPVNSVRILIDGRPVQTARSLDFKKAADPTPLPTENNGTSEIVVTLPERDCEIGLIAENANAPSTPATVRVRYTAPAKTTPGEDTFVIKPKLYVLAVGVGKYALPGHDLDFPAKDASDFTAALKAQEGGLYREVVTRTLTDAQATRDDVVDGLEWIQRQATQKDVAMVFLSGHGANDPDGNYYYLPQNFDAEHWRRTGVSFSDIQSALSNIKGKALFFVDTCHSGNMLGTTKQKGAGVDIVPIVNELTSAENGVIVFASSTGKQVSLEDPAWGNGAFTKAVVEAITGSADYNKTGKITVNMIDLYISERVKELTKGTQTPTTTKPTTVPDFPVAIKK